MDNQGKTHVLKALQTTNDLIGLVNNPDALRNDKVCDILLGVMRHCACKIYRQVEHERQALKAKD
jgi:hypothetical protein